MPSKHEQLGMPKTLVILGNPASRRVIACSQAGERAGFKIRQVSYLDFLADESVLRHALVSGSVLRIESPSEDAALTSALLQIGTNPLLAAGKIPVKGPEVSKFAGMRGEIAAPRQWYWGYRELLRRIEDVLTDKPSVRCMAHPQEIPLLFDKHICQARWSAAGLPVPRFWTHCRGYDDVRALLNATAESRAGESASSPRSRRLFVKLRYGYSAIGAVAIERVGQRIRAITATEIDGSDSGRRLFLSKKVRVLLDESEIAWLIDRLASEEIIVENWLPKAKIDGKSFDLRVVVIAGRALHTVGRASRSPFTNLNLDATRIPALTVQTRLGMHWQKAMQTCETAATLFTKSLYMGIDLLVHPNHRDFYLLEANAFGDYLPGLVHEGQDIYDAQFGALIRSSQREEQVA
jgi:hypothetical protein